MVRHGHRCAGCGVRWVCDDLDCYVGRESLCGACEEALRLLPSPWRLRRAEAEPPGLPLCQADLVDVQRERNRGESDTRDIVAQMAKAPVVPTCIHGYPMLPGQMGCCPTCRADVEAAVAREKETP